MLCVLPMKRGQLEVAGVRLTDPPSSSKLLFAFTTPLSLVNSMARIHVRLLGPCFKTGRVEPFCHQFCGLPNEARHVKRTRDFLQGHSLTRRRATLTLQFSSSLRQS